MKYIEIKTSLGESLFEYANKLIKEFRLLKYHNPNKEFQVKGKFNGVELYVDGTSTEESIINKYYEKEEKKPYLFYWFCDAQQGEERAGGKYEDYHVVYAGNKETAFEKYIQHCNEKNNSNYLLKDFTRVNGNCWRNFFNIYCIELPYDVYTWDEFNQLEVSHDCKYVYCHHPEEKIILKDGLFICTVCGAKSVSKSLLMENPSKSTF
jgi:hypothetical protein